MNVHRGLGCESNVIILHCTGNCVHTQLTTVCKFVNVDPGSQSVYGGQFG